MRGKTNYHVMPMTSTVLLNRDDAMLRSSSKTSRSSHRTSSYSVYQGEDDMSLDSCGSFLSTVPLHRDDEMLRSEKSGSKSGSKTSRRIHKTSPYSVYQGDDDMSLDSCGSFLSSIASRATRNTNDIYSGNEYIFKNKESSKCGAAPVPIEERFQTYHNDRQKSMMHLRAGSTLFILVGIMFILVQLTYVVQHDRTEFETLRDRSNRGPARNYYSMEAGEEGFDRPLTSDQMKRLGLKASSSGLSKSIRTAKKTLTEFDSVDNAGPFDPLPGSVDPLPGPGDPFPAPVHPLPATKVAPQSVKTHAIDATLSQQKEASATIPPSFSNLAELTVADPNHADKPFLWQIPMSGATTIRHILSDCLGSTLASEVGEQSELINDKKLQVFTSGKAKFVNVNTHNIQGIKRAESLNLLPSELADIITSPYVHETTSLFTPQRKGRMFAMIRHPIQRAAAQYAYLKTFDPEVKEMTLVQYASSDRIENNWMTRFLSDTHSGEIGVEHLLIAKEILKSKCIVGLEHSYFTSLRRFEEYFGWKYINESTKQYECRKHHLEEKADTLNYPSPEVKRGSQIWALIMWQNKFDMKLYEYAETLFKEQVSLVPIHD